MSNFMGPMAPPPAAQPQPQALDFKTDPNQRQRFRQFMRDRVSPNVGQAPAMMPNGIGTTMPTPQMAMPQMPMMPQPPMMPSMAPGAGIDVFSPQYMNQPAAPMGFEDGGSVPPRETDIRGMHHELAYITPDEADILMALGGSGEPGPMGIPQFAPGSDDKSAGQSASSGSGNSDNASDDEMGDLGVMSGPSGSSDDDDPFAGEEGDDFSVGNYGNPDGSFDANDFADFGVQAAKDRAVRDAFVVDRHGNPIGTKSGYVTQGAATDAAKAAGYQALGLPDPNSDLASADVEASYGVPTNSIDSVSAAPPGTTNKADLLGFNYDLLQSNIDKAIEARRGMPTQSSPLVGSPFAAGVTSSGINAAKDRLSARTGSNTSAPSSNVVSDFSPTPADQLADVYGIDLDALNAAVDDDFAAIGNRSGPGVEGPGTGYTDQGLPVGLEFATNPQTGAQVTTNLAGLTEQQKAEQPLSMDIAQFIGSSPYGYEIDPATGNPIGQVGTAPFGVLGALTTLAQDFIMGPPQTTKDLIERGAYTGMTGQNNDDDIFGGDRDVNVLLSPPLGEVVSAPTVPNQISGIGTPGTPTASGPVLVPSTRTSAPFSGQMPVGYGTPQTSQLNPYSLAEMQRYQQMLARLGQSKSPIGLANGGSVLDAAAGKFLESLTAA